MTVHSILQSLPRYYFKGLSQNQIPIYFLSSQALRYQSQSVSKAEIGPLTQKLRSERRAQAARPTLLQINEYQGLRLPLTNRNLRRPWLLADLSGCPVGCPAARLSGRLAVQQVGLSFRAFEVLMAELANISQGGDASSLLPLCAAIKFFTRLIKFIYYEKATIPPII